MGFFGFGGGDVVDLTGGYRSQPTKKTESSSETDTDGDAMRLLGGLANAGNDNNDNNDSNDDEERRKKFSKTLSDMTEKIEDLSNQIYKLSLRLEVAEKKLRITNN